MTANLCAPAAEMPAYKMYDHRRRDGSSSYRRRTPPPQRRLKTPTRSRQIFSTPKQRDEVMDRLMGAAYPTRNDYRMSRNLERSRSPDRSDSSPSVGSPPRRSVRHGHGGTKNDVDNHNGYERIRSDREESFERMRQKHHEIMAEVKRMDAKNAKTCAELQKKLLKPNAGGIFNHRVQTGRIERPRPTNHRQHTRNSNHTDRGARERMLEEREIAMDDRETMIQEREADLKHREDTVRHREEEHDRRRNEFERRQHHLTERETEVSNGREQLIEIRALLKEQEGVLEKWDALLKKKAADLEKREDPLRTLRFSKPKQGIDQKHLPPRQQQLQQQLQQRSGATNAQRPQDRKRKRDDEDADQRNKQRQAEFREVRDRIIDFRQRTGIEHQAHYLDGVKRQRQAGNSEIEDLIHNHRQRQVKKRAAGEASPNPTASQFSDRLYRPDHSHRAENDSLARSSKRQRKHHGTDLDDEILRTEEYDRLAYASDDPNQASESVDSNTARWNAFLNEGHEQQTNGAALGYGYSTASEDFVEHDEEDDDGNGASLFGSPKDQRYSPSAEYRESLERDRFIRNNPGAYVDSQGNMQCPAPPRSPTTDGSSLPDYEPTDYEPTPSPPPSPALHRGKLHKHTLRCEDGCVSDDDEDDYIVGPVRGQQHWSRMPNGYLPVPPGDISPAQDRISFLSGYSSTDMEMRRPPTSPDRHEDRDRSSAVWPKNLDYGPAEPVAQAPAASAAQQPTRRPTASEDPMGIYDMTMRKASSREKQVAEGVAAHPAVAEPSANRASSAIQTSQMQRQLELIGPVSTDQVLDAHQRLMAAMREHEQAETERLRGRGRQ